MSKPEQFLILVDNDKYEWDRPTITGAQLRVLAAVPENVQIFLHVPGKPDEEIQNGTVVDLAAHHGPARFSTQSSGSQAG